MLVLGVGGAQASLVSMDFANAGGDAYQLQAGGVLSFDNLVVTGSSNGGDIMSYLVTIGDLTINTASRTEVNLPGMNIVSYGFTVDTTTFGVWDPTGTTQYIAGTLSVDQIVIINGTGVNLDADSDVDDITGIAAMNNPTAQTLLDMAAIGQAAFSLVLTIDPLVNFDALILASSTGTGPGAGSVAAVPEPATAALLGFGIVTLFVRRRRK
ncbi:MAG: PEP-CTERM sorting domain-containing protein [Planctomycetes bacterium]|nr:PEP-CTERM sorting domain-containing protein [Planctomycetota bacterium]